jgi:hypothetical protein
MCVRKESRIAEPRIKAMRILILSLFASLSLGLPVWPSNFQVSWTLYNIPTEAQPPYATNPENIPPAPYSAGRGVTFYDNSIR